MFSLKQHLFGFAWFFDKVYHLFAERVMNSKIASLKKGKMEYCHSVILDKNVLVRLTYQIYFTLFGYDIAIFVHS